MKLRAMAGKGSGGGGAGLLLLAVLWHGLGLALFVNWHDVVHNPPIHYTDYATHYAGAWAAGHHLPDGHLWGYNPFFHAGYPGGTLFEADNKGVELATWLLHRMGLSLPHAFDALVLALMAVAPFAVYAAARLVGLSRAAAALSQLLALSLWYGDPNTRWTWQGGTLAYVSAALGSLVIAAAFWHWAGLAGDGSRRYLALGLSRLARSRGAARCVRVLSSRRGYGHGRYCSGPVAGGRCWWARLSPLHLC